MSLDLPVSNVRGFFDNQDRFVEPTNELIEYFIQYKTDEVIDTLTTLSFTFDIDENPILREILNEHKYNFRHMVIDAITEATLILNHDYDDPQVEIQAPRLKPKLDVNIIFPVNTAIGELTANQFEGQIVTFEAVVSDWSAKDTVTFTAVYKCPECGSGKTMKFVGLKTTERCVNCKVFLEYFVPVKSEDMRRIGLRENINEYTKHKQPYKIVADTYGRIAHNVELSSKVIVTGVFTSIPLAKENGRMNQRFIPTIQVINMQKKSEVMSMPDDTLLAKFKDLEKQGKLIDSIIDGFAFNIFEKRMEKKAVICSILGSEWIGKNNPPQIYILLVGDPDTYKSTIMKYVSKVFDNCVIADATAVSGNGIKAVTVKMEDGTWSIRAGLLPTHHGGVVLFDEFGDLKAEIYSELKQCMIDGRIRKHMAGEDFDAIAETGIVASMNPTWDVWDENRTFLENLDVLGKALITRWDAIFKFSIKFCNDHEDDIDTLFTQSDINGKPKEFFTDDEIKLFFNYARTFHPKITEEALQRRNEFFRNIRNKSNDNSNFETRVKNSIIKFATALAKWHLSPIVTEEHVDEALAIYKYSLETCNLRFENGEFINETKLKRTQDMRLNAVEEAFNSCRDAVSGKAQIDEVRQLAMQSGVFKDITQFHHFWENLKKSDRLTIHNEHLATLHPLRF